MWQATSKNELIIEVWEKLWCDSVGEEEIKAIMQAVAGVFGEHAVDSPMTIARLLADEGAYLRHAEIMKLYLETVEAEHNAALVNIIDTSSLNKLYTSLKNAGNLRKKYLADENRTDLRSLLEKVKALKTKIENEIENDGQDVAVKIEVVQWMTIWLQSHELFEQWVELRHSSADFKQKFVGLD